MEKRLRIGEFVKLTGSTLKTVKYYHKIGLLPEPERSPGGYRLYGPVELTRMRLIKHLKSLGMNLPSIKETLGDAPQYRTLREVLQSLRLELLNEKKNLEDRVAKIDKLLAEDRPPLDEDAGASSSFQMIAGILGPDQMENYARTCPEIFKQHHKLYGMLDDFHWGDDYREKMRALAEYFKTHPEQYQVALDYGVRLARLSHLPEGDPEIETLAREAAAFIKSIPQLKEMLCNQWEPQTPFSDLYDQMIAGILPTNRLKYMEYFHHYLHSQA